MTWRIIREDQKSIKTRDGVLKKNGPTALKCAHTHTCTIAGSQGSPCWDFGGSDTVMSLMSLPLKMMYS